MRIGTAADESFTCNIGAVENTYDGVVDVDGVDDVLMAFLFLSLGGVVDGLCVFVCADEVCSQVPLPLSLTPSFPHSVTLPFGRCAPLLHRSVVQSFVRSVVRSLRLLTLRFCSLGLSFAQSVAPLPHSLSRSLASQKENEYLVGEGVVRGWKNA